MNNNPSQILHYTARIHTFALTDNGWKSSTTGIDLEFNKSDTRYIVSIKSSPNWGNNSQIEKMRNHFKVASRIIRQGDPKVTIKAINGCCYGRDKKPDKGDYFKYCGQQFWEFVSNDSEFYTRIIKPLGYDINMYNKEFAKRYNNMIEEFSNEFAKQFCNEQGAIDWNRLVTFSSSKNIV